MRGGLATGIRTHPAYAEFSCMDGGLQDADYGGESLRGAEHMAARHRRQARRTVQDGLGHTWAQARLKEAHAHRQLSEIARQIGKTPSALWKLLGYRSQPARPPSFALLWKLVGYFSEERSEDFFATPDEQIEETLELLILNLGPERLLILAQLEAEEACALVDRYIRRRSLQ